MNKVDFTLNNGRVERMHPKIAELLQRKGKGTYQTTALTKAPQRAVLVPEPPPQVPVQPEPLVPEPDVVPTQTPEPPPVQESQTADAPVDFASMTVDELREHAKKQGVQVHHRAGAEKIIEAIEKKAGE